MASRKRGPTRGAARSRVRPVVGSPLAEAIAKAYDVARPHDLTAVPDGAEQAYALAAEVLSALLAAVETDSTVLVKLASVARAGTGQPNRLKSRTVKEAAEDELLEHLVRTIGLPERPLGDATIADILVRHLGRLLGAKRVQAAARAALKESPLEWDVFRGDEKGVKRWVTKIVTRTMKLAGDALAGKR